MAQQQKPHLGSISICYTPERLIRTKKYKILTPARKHLIFHYYSPTIPVKFSIVPENSNDASKFVTYSTKSNCDFGITNTLSDYSQPTSNETTNPSIDNTIFGCEYFKIVDDTFCQLQRKVEELKIASKSIFTDVEQLSKDYQNNESRIEILTTELVTFRHRIEHFNYLDDLLKLLQGEVEIISQKNWPFTIGHSGLDCEELNLII